MRYLLILPALLASGMSIAEPVLHVRDGDSLVIAAGGQEVDVRLAGVDAPEFKQPGGDEARAALVNLVNGREVELELVGSDKYRRMVAVVSVGGVNVNAEMVRMGLAWVRRAYNPAPELIRLEDQARKNGLGLWAEEEPVPPWVWRRMHPRRLADRINLSAIPKVECGSKRYCREMEVCEEAIAFLRQCKLKRIDGDNDGVPCERLCRNFR